MLINLLLMASGRRHFEARQRPETPESRHHLNAAVWPEVCRYRTKTCKLWRIIPEHNYLVKITSWMTYNHISLSRKEPDKRKMIKNGSDINHSPRQSRERSCDVRALEFSTSPLQIWLPMQPYWRPSSNLDYFPISMI